MEWEKSEVRRRRSSYVLDILFPVEQQSKQRTEKVLDMFSRHNIHHISFEFLRAKIGQGPGKCLREARSEHNDEL